jgi:hypothetical protein
MTKREREKGKKGKRAVGRILPIKLFLLIAAAFFSFSCQPNAAILESSKNATSERANSLEAANNQPKNSFARDLETMRTANFDFIYVFRRKDGAPLDADDKKYVKLNSPTETNRFILSDEDKAVIAGSKYKFAEQNLMALRDRFNIEDFSKPPIDTPPNAENNANSSANS